MTGVGKVAWPWLFLAALTALVVLFTLVPVNICVQFRYCRKKWQGHFQLAIWPGLKYEKKVFGPTAALPEQPAREIPPPPKKTAFSKRIRKLRIAAESVLPVLPSFLRRLTLKKLRWHTRIGLSDAFSTAVAAGLLWGVKGSLVSSLYRLVRPLSLPDLAVLPDFFRPSCALYFESRISVRPADVFIAGVKAGYLYLKAGVRRRLS